MRLLLTLLCVLTLASAAHAPGAFGQDRPVSPNVGLPYLGVNGTFTLDQQELAARDPRNPKRVVFEKMERFSFFDDLQGTQPIAQDCMYAYRGPAGDPYYYPDRAKTSIWELFELQSGERACRRFSYVALRAPHGNPIHMHLRYGDEQSSFRALLMMSNGPEDKAKLDPWWSVYCVEGLSGCDK